MSKKEIKPKYDFMYQSYLEAYQNAYTRYKEEVKKGYDMSGIGSDGKFILLEDGNTANIKKAEKELLRAGNDFHDFVEKYDDYSED